MKCLSVCLPVQKQKNQSHDKKISAQLLRVKKNLTFEIKNHRNQTENKMDENTLLRPKQVYTIFCSAFKYKSTQKKSSNASKLIPWQAHAFQDNQPNHAYNDETAKKTSQLENDFHNYFYESFADCLQGKSFDLPANLQPAYTLPLNHNTEKRSHKINISYADYFLFPHNIGIVAFKVEYHENITFDDLTLLIHTIRSEDHSWLLFPGEEMPFDVEDPLLNGNKYKAFTVAEHDLEFDEDYSSDHLLFDIGTCSPIGASIGKGKNPSLKPTPGYFQQILEENKIAVFDNWSALALFDTFTVLHKGSLYNYNWETKYFRFLYVITLYVKNYLIELNKVFHDPKDDDSLENEFYNFDRDFNFDQISYNFLPQVIYEKTRFSQHLDREIEKLKIAIDRDTAIKEKIRNEQEAESEKRINTALLIVAFLAVVSAVWDGSEWAATVINFERNQNYSIYSVAFMVVVIFVIIILLLKKNAIKKH